MCLPACPKVLLVLSSGCISEGRPREFRRRRACHDRPAVPLGNAGLSQQAAVSFRWQTTSEAALCKLNGLEQQRRPASTAMLLQIRLQSAPRAAVLCWSPPAGHRSRRATGQPPDAGVKAARLPIPSAASGGHACSARKRVRLRCAEGPGVQCCIFSQTFGILVARPAASRQR